MSLSKIFTGEVAAAFVRSGYAEDFGLVKVSQLPELGDFQCDGALAAARKYKKSPMNIAEDVCRELSDSQYFAKVSVAKPGFLNLTVKEEFLVSYLHRLTVSQSVCCENLFVPVKIVMDYGGPNAAKPLHVGHLRSAIIGESLKRIARFVGHNVVSDIHLGDWGLQMGMIISEFALLHPDLAYFKSGASACQAEDLPKECSDLEGIYAQASKACNLDSDRMELARAATKALQDGDTGHVALWKHLIAVSVADLKAAYQCLNVDFDVWEGESDALPYIGPMIADFRKREIAYESQGALVVDVAEPDDKRPLPPLLLSKSDGASLYATTDLATIIKRVESFEPDLIVYVVDKRQGDHFRQVFRCARKGGILPSSTRLIHVSFGTMNGEDGKPFRTREGGLIKLKDLLQMIVAKAEAKMQEVRIGCGIDACEREEIARKVGVAALKFADLCNYRDTDYIFNFDRFCSFEGKTGPYVLYAAVRMKAILRKAHARGLLSGVFDGALDSSVRSLALKISEFPDVIERVWDNFAPNLLCEYVYSLASAYNTLYHSEHILNNTDSQRQRQLLSLSELTHKVLVTSLDLLGIEVPEKM